MPMMDLKQIIIELPGTPKIRVAVVFINENLWRVKPPEVRAFNVDKGEMVQLEKVTFDYTSGSRG